jgi:hypothetical protein
MGPTPVSFLIATLSAPPAQAHGAILALPR